MKAVWTKGVTYEVETNRWRPRAPRRAMRQRRRWSWSLNFVRVVNVLVVVDECWMDVGSPRIATEGNEVENL